MSNPKTLELRNLLPGERPEGVSCCSVCGKPHSSLTAGAKVLPIHLRALAEDWAGHFRNLSKALGRVGMLALVDQEKWNGQLEFYRAQLTLAREEHDAYQPEDKPGKERHGAKTAALLVEMLNTLEIQVEVKDATSASIHLLTEMLATEMRKLFGPMPLVVAKAAEELPVEMEHAAGTSTL